MQQNVDVWEGVKKLFREYIPQQSWLLSDKIKTIFRMSRNCFVLKLKLIPFFCILNFWVTPSLSTCPNDKIVKSIFCPSQHYGCFLWMMVCILIKNIIEFLFFRWEKYIHNQMEILLKLFPPGFTICLYTYIYICIYNFLFDLQ